MSKKQIVSLSSSNGAATINPLSVSFLIAPRFESDCSDRGFFIFARLEAWL